MVYYVLVLVQMYISIYSNFSVDLFRKRALLVRLLILLNWTILIILFDYFSFNLLIKVKIKTEVEVKVQYIIYFYLWSMAANTWKNNYCSNTIINLFLSNVLKTFTINTIAFLVSIAYFL